MARGVLLDIDGVLTVSWEPLPGAADTIAWLDQHDVPFRLVTNTSSRSRRQIAELLGQAGMSVERDRILTAVTSAARHLADEHGGVPCLVVNDGDLSEDLEGTEQAGPEDAGVVLLGGAGPATGYGELNDAFRLAAEGRPIVALHRNARYQTAEGPALDMGAFIVGVEAAADVEIPIVGKPAPEFFRAVLEDLGSPVADALMVGDDIASDVLGAQDVGITGVLVRTGKFREGDLQGDGPRPDHVIDTIADLPALLEGLD